MGLVEGWLVVFPAWLEMLRAFCGPLSRSRGPGVGWSVQVSYPGLSSVDDDGWGVLRGLDRLGAGSLRAGFGLGRVGGWRLRLVRG